MERRKHWEWTIEDNDKWDEKMTLKKEKSEFEFDGEYSMCCYATRILDR